MPVLTDPFISINGVHDLSSHFTSADVPETADAPESTAFGVTTHRRTAGGLKDWTVTLEYNQDFDAGAARRHAVPAAGHVLRPGHPP